MFARPLGRIALGLALWAAAAPPARALDSLPAITVFAAASLSESFQALGAAFEAKAHGHVTFSFGASSLLVTQLQQGAPADVIATADETTLAKAGDLIGAPRTFARNRLAIAVEKGNPKTVQGLADLARPGLAVVLAAEQVPVGKYGKEALAKAGVTVTPRSLEPDVKAVLNKVALGEADAGIVYATDVTAAQGKVDGVEIPAAQNVSANYPIAVVKKSQSAEAAQAFADFVLSPEGRTVLARYGFAAP
ncbi:MAG TPA: molybdate ABC transporter substrate-binding protein [Myxococcota bacterium]|nr:molybdate ABC transporter substrate-binding protein [Myxococcota bacterium]